MSVFSLGTDPEFFVLDTDRRPVPAFKFFPGKEEKRQVAPDYSSRVLAFRDGYAVEINIPPASCRENLTLSMLQGLKGTLKCLPMGYTLSSLPAVPIRLPEDLDGAPEDVRTFGCDPSWNAYTGDCLTVPLDASEHPWRYAGGHMHLSIPTGYKGYTGFDAYQWIFNAESIMLFVRMLDLYLGVPLTLWFAKEETFRRREYYGKAGEFRFQEYMKAPATGLPAYVGVEYRTPGPEVWNAPPVASFAFGVMRSVAENFDYLRSKWDAGMEEAIRHAVNTGEGARALLRDSAFCNVEMFEKLVLRNRPFQTLNTDFKASSEIAQRGWAHYSSVGAEFSLF